MTTREEIARFAFNRSIEYLQNNDLENAKLSFMSDINKSKLNNNPLMFIIINSARTSKDLIKQMSGFCYMPKDIQEYYDHPEKCMRKYNINDF
jgi:hypothetical protein